MTINISKENIKEFFKKRAVLINAVVLSAIFLILIVVFYSRYVFDCVSVSNSIHARNESSVTYSVFYSKTGQDIGLPEKAEMNETYLLKYIEYIEVKNTAEVRLSKSAVLYHEYKATATYVVRTRGNGNTPVLSTPKPIDVKPSVIEEGLDSVRLILLPADRIKIDLKPYIGDFEKFTAGAGKNFTGEVAVEIEFRVRSGDGVVDINTKCGIIIPFTSESSGGTINIKSMGKPVQEKNFPERTVQFPKWYITILAVAGTILFLTLAVLSLRELLAEKDPYKRAVKAVLKKFADDIITVEEDSVLPGTAPTRVKAFKDLIKYARTAGRSVVYTEIETGSLFYVLCDGGLYTFNILKASDSTA